MGPEAQIRADFFGHAFTANSLRAAMQLSIVSAEAGQDWWCATSEASEMKAQLIGQSMLEAIRWMRAIDYATKMAEMGANIGNHFSRVMSQPSLHPAASSAEPVAHAFWDDSSRLFHKLLRHTIFHHRAQVFPQLPKLFQSYVQVGNDHYGILPSSFQQVESQLTSVPNNAPILHTIVQGVAYCSYTPDAGDSYLVPLAWQLQDPTSEHPAAFASHVGGLRCLVSCRSVIEADCGIVVFGSDSHNVGSRMMTRRHGHVALMYSGYDKSNEALSFHQSPLEFEKASVDRLAAGASLLRMAAQPGIPMATATAMENGVSALAHRQANERSSFMMDALQSALNEDWPDEHQMTFIGMPRADSAEADLVECLVLEELQQLKLSHAAESSEQQASSSSSESEARNHALLLIEHVEEELGYTVEREVESARARMERWIQEQNGVQREIQNRQATSVSAATSSSAPAAPEWASAASASAASDTAVVLLT